MKKNQTKITLFIFQIIVKLRIYHQTGSRTLHKLIYRRKVYPAFFLFACERCFETASFTVASNFGVLKSLITKIDVVNFLQIQAAFWKTNYITLSYLLIPIYGQDISENDFLTVAAKFRFCSIFSECICKGLKVL